MKIYTYSQAREKLADILEESKSEEVVIRRHKGDMFSGEPADYGHFLAQGIERNLGYKRVVLFRFFL